MHFSIVTSCSKVLIIIFKKLVRYKQSYVYNSSNDKFKYYKISKVIIKTNIVHYLAWKLS